MLPALSSPASPARPSLAGFVGHRSASSVQSVTLLVETIEHGRAYSERSGTLALELWALSESYSDGDFFGHSLASVHLGVLTGDNAWHHFAPELTLTSPPDGTWLLGLRLREWTGSGYTTRDLTAFVTPVTFPLSPPH